ncbi:MAG: TlpA disulfide reductase family protein [Bacteroidales bacterium]|nr:TlpA disulfide reductase family protein [Bacteroidales bacterium]
MKKLAFLTLAFMTLLMVACGSKTAYTIEGHVSDKAFFNQKVYLIDADGKTTLDSTTITDQGIFLLNGKADTMRMTTLQTFTGQYSGQAAYYGMLVLEPGRIYIDLVNDSLSGTPLNDKLSAYRYSKDMKASERTIRDLASQMQNLTDERAQAALLLRYDSLENVLVKKIIESTEKLYQENADNILGAYALNVLAEYKHFNFATLDSIMKKSNPSIAQYAPNRDMLEHLHLVEKTSAGHPYINIEGTLHPSKDRSSLSQLINGKVAILDFWASWCGPCRKEIQENLIPLYHKYQKKGLVVVGVDMSDTEQGLAAAVKQLGIPYPILVADGNPGEIYGIVSIPQIILVGADGVIIARDLRGEAIENAVEEALK